jgi:hypothetical protein
MTGTGLFNAVKAALGPAQDQALQEAALKPICEAIVSYIQSNAAVAVPALGLSVTSAPGAVTGTATGTIS